MVDDAIPLLARLRDTGETIADPKDDVRGRIATDADGAILGTITSLIVDTTERRIRFLEVTTARRSKARLAASLIPVEAISHISPTTVRVDRTGEHVAGGPAYDPDIIDYLALFARVYGHYNVAPYWDRA